jgi:hypothetical protein
MPRRDNVKAKEASATNGHAGKDAAAAAAVTSPSDIGGTGSQPPASLMSAPEPVASPPLLGKLLGISGEDAAVSDQHTHTHTHTRTRTHAHAHTHTLISKCVQTRKKYWMPDELSTTCYDCETVFSTFKRRHHCRVCGQVFCSRCVARCHTVSRFSYSPLLTMWSTLAGGQLFGPVAPRRAVWLPGARARLQLLLQSPQHGTVCVVFLYLHWGSLPWPNDPRRN